LIAICDALTMQDTFWADVLVAVIGAGLTVAIAGVTYWIRNLVVEHRAFQILINDMHGRRALAVDEPVTLRFASRRRSFKYANESIISLRDEIKSTRANVRQREKLQKPLVNMLRACNRYLEFSERSPDSYLLYLNRLQRELNAEVLAVVRKRKFLKVLPPGDGAL